MLVRGSSRGWVAPSLHHGFRLIESTTYSDLLGKVNVSILVWQHLPFAVSLSLLLLLA